MGEDRRGERYVKRRVGVRKGEVGGVVDAAPVVLRVPHADEAKPEVGKARRDGALAPPDRRRCHVKPVVRTLPEVAGQWQRDASRATADVEDPRVGPQPAVLNDELEPAGTAACELSPTRVILKAAR